MYENETLTLKTSLGPYDTGVDVTLEGTAKRKLSQAQQIQKISPWKKYLAVALITGLIVGGGVWWCNFKTDFEPADQNKFAYELPEKPFYSNNSFFNCIWNIMEL